MAMIDNARSWARKQLTPVTIGLMGAFILLSVLFWFTRGKYMDDLGFDTNWLSKPWSILTYPFAYMGLGDIGRIFSSIMVLYWMHMTCASVERTIGTPKYIALWAVLTILPALLFWMGEMIVGQRVPLFGPFFPIAGISYIWARNNKTFVMTIWFVPLTGLWLSWLIIGGVIFGYGLGAPMLGLFAALYLIPAHLYAENMIPFLPYQVRGYQNYRPSKAQKQKEANYFAEVDKRKQEREERERLRKLFESSLDDDSKR